MSPTTGARHRRGRPHSASTPPGTTPRTRPADQLRHQRRGLLPAAPGGPTTQPTATRHITPQHHTADNSACHATHHHPAPGGTFAPDHPSVPSRQVERLNRGVSSASGPVAATSCRGGCWAPIRPLWRSTCTAGSTKVKLNAHQPDRPTTSTSGAAAGFGLHGPRGSWDPPSTRPSRPPTGRRNFLDIPLQIPPGGTTPSGEAYTYTANDVSGR